MPNLVEDKAQLIENARNFNELTPSSDSFAYKVLNSFKHWYYFEESDIFAPSKFIGYENTTVENYRRGEGRDGRETEKVLQEWFKPLEQDSQRFEELSTKLYKYVNNLNRQVKKGYCIHIEKSGPVETRAVVQRLKKFGETRGGSDWSELDSETNRLVRNNPFAFLLAVAFDRGMAWQKAWRIPVEINRTGCLDPAQLASMSETDLIDLLDGLAVRPRYGARHGAKTLSDAARLVCERFGGDAGAIWNGASPAEAEKTLQEIHGLGAGIASMTTRILRDDFGCFRGQERQIDVKPDVHLVRVFRRVGLVNSDSPNEAIRTARRLNPEFPGELDWPAWRIGQQWCHATEPNCALCPLTQVCARRI